LRCSMRAIVRQATSGGLRSAAAARAQPDLPLIIIINIITT